MHLVSAQCFYYMAWLGSPLFDAVDAFGRHVARSQALTAILAGRVMVRMRWHEAWGHLNGERVGDRPSVYSPRCSSMKPSPITKKLDSPRIRGAAFIEPMEYLAVSKPPENSQWLWDIKLDGYRAIAAKIDRGVRLFSRHILSRLADKILSAK